MNTWINATERQEKEIANAGDPPHGDKDPPLDEDMNDSQDPVNPLLTDGAIMDALFQMSQSITI